MPTTQKTLHHCAGCGQRNRPSGFVLCRDCWHSKVPRVDKIAFNKLRGQTLKAEAAAVIIANVRRQSAEPILGVGWHSMTTAPKGGLVEVILLLKDGKEVTGHWASDLSGEDQPAFEGWFKRVSQYSCMEVNPVGWKPVQS